MTTAELLEVVFLPTVALIFALLYLLYQRQEKLHDWLVQFLGKED